MVRTQRFHCWGPGSIPGWGTKILQAVQLSPKKMNNKNKDYYYYASLVELTPYIIVKNHTIHRAQAIWRLSPRGLCHLHGHSEGNQWPHVIKDKGYFSDPLILSSQQHLGFLTSLTPSTLPPTQVFLLLLWPHLPSLLCRFTLLRHTINCEGPSQAHISRHSKLSWLNGEFCSHEWTAGNQIPMLQAPYRMIPSLSNQQGKQEKWGLWVHTLLSSPPDAPEFFCFRFRNLRGFWLGLFWGSWE